MKRCPFCMGEIPDAASKCQQSASDHIHSKPPVPLISLQSDCEIQSCRSSVRAKSSCTRKAL